ncbi:MAG: response regulator [Methyloligellaceae bacterium]
MNSETSSAAVLVVDDDLMSRTKIAIAVEKLGYQSIKASGGEEGLDQLRKTSIDVMLLDLLMPEMDGFSVLEAIQQTPDLPKIPIVVISSLEDEESEARAIALGATRCLTKGFEIAALRTCLYEVLATDSE